MDWDAEHTLLRTVRCVSGTVELVMDCEPAFDYNRASASWEYSASGYGEAVARASSNPDAHPTLRLTTNLRIGLEGRQARARTRLKEGGNVFVALTFSKHPAPQTYDDAVDKMWATSEYWRQWINIGSFPDHPWRSYLQRSALTLKGLAYSPTGALLAASTTSLPETPQGERNWDYRYAWIRDSTFALWGLYTLGLDREADDFFSFIADVSGANDGERHPLQVMYGVGGERSLVEEELHHLSGYDSARPVRIGNGAYNQMQHDIWGAMLDSVYLHTSSREQIPETVAGDQQQVEEASKHWRAPDRGIWEVRGEPQHFTASKIMCWVAMDRGAKLAELHGWTRTPRSGAPSPRRSRPTSWSTAWTPRGVDPALRGRRAGRLAAAGGVDPVPAGRRSAAPRDGVGDRRRAYRGRAGAAVPRRGDRRRIVRRGGDFHHLLVLAGVGAGRDRRDPAGQAPEVAANLARERAARLTGVERREFRAANADRSRGGSLSHFCTGVRVSLASRCSRSANRALAGGDCTTSLLPMSAFGGKADMPFCTANVRL